MEARTYSEEQIKQFCAEKAIALPETVNEYILTCLYKRECFFLEEMNDENESLQYEINMLNNEIYNLESDK